MKGKKVYVGMSGGVDSSVSAALLKEQGFDVTGVFIKVWQPDWFESSSECTWREDRLDAMRVAVKLGIPFVTLDLEKEYKKDVVDYMISEYRIGRTPNPDIMCNRYVKFGGFFDWALKQGADFVATGHYARVENSKLLSGRDENKDQSYFLWTLTRRELEKTLFPVGDMEKPEVRRLARKFDLPTAEKKDSQGLCFMGKIDIKEFLSHYIEPKKGDVLNEKGEVIGEHDGAFFLTLGERRGFTVTKKTSEDKPYYIVDRDIQKNTVTVSHVFSDTYSSSGKTVYRASQGSWTGDIPIVGCTYKARIRHRGELTSCRLDSVQGTEFQVFFEQPVVIASGQSLVLYDGDTCFGGGIVV